MPDITRETEFSVYCCKKWVAGELKRFYSRRPCSQGSVMCSDADPPKPVLPGEGAGGDPSCEKKCEEAYGGRGTGPGGRARQSRNNIQLQRCLDRCRGTGGGGGGGGGGQDCDPGFRWSESNQKCIKIKPGQDCDPGFRWSDREGKCVKIVDPKKCDPGFRWSDEMQRCVRIIKIDECDPGWHWDSTLEKCVPNKPGQGPCPGSGYEMELGTSTCDEGYSPKKDPESGNWWCCKEEGPEECDPGFHIDPDTGECVEDGPGNCEDGYTWDEELEECVEDGDGPGGEFEWTEGLQGLLGRIQERANYLLDYPRGLSPSERQGVINYAIESVKSGEKGAIQSKRDQLARSGLLGSGFEFDEVGKIQRETRASQTQIRRELGIDELDRRFSELMGTTGMAQGLTGTLMQGEQIPEVLSGARRSEGQSAINALLQLFGGSMGGQNTGYNDWIMQALMGGQGGGGAGIMDWLPWILATQQGSRTRG